MKYGGHATVKGLDILFDETDPVSEYLHKIPHEELMEQLRKYHYSLDKNCREYGDMMALLRRRKRVPRWLGLPYLVTKGYMITKNLKLAVSRAWR